MPRLLTPLRIGEMSMRLATTMFATRLCVPKTSAGATSDVFNEDLKLSVVFLAEPPVPVKWRIFQVSETCSTA